MKTWCVIVVCCAAGTSAVRADIDPLSGIDFVTVGAVGNAPWAGDGTAGDRAIGRGSVGYEYRIGKFEITTAQYAEFMNAAFDRPQSEWIPHLAPPNFWGAVGTTPNTTGGLRWSVPTGNEMLPVGNVSWRMAAILCNWYHNGKSLDREAFLTGAYDVSTFGYATSPQGFPQFTDQLTRSPGARYFIPTWDEHLKASHYDPNKQNSDGSTGGWWTYNNGTDTPLIAGPPGVGQANYGFSNPDPFSISLGAYTQTQSPWGLSDVAGATAEWTEGLVEDHVTGRRFRMIEGSYWDSSAGFVVSDSIYTEGADELPQLNIYPYGIRIAAAIPSPTIGTTLLVLGAVLGSRRRKLRRAACVRR